jgi:hypothetical protein
MFQQVILHGETGSGIHSHSREGGFTWLWWIQGTVSATLTAVGIDKTTTKGPSSGALVAEHSISLPTQHLLVYKVHESCQANRESLSYPVIDF